MSAPLHHTDPLQGALIECMSALSALNMHADPIPGATGYLSETDAWAKHAAEHLRAAIELLTGSGLGKVITKPEPTSRS